MAGQIGKRKGVTIKYASFEFGDTCREALDSGADIELIAKLLKRKPNTIEKWVRLASIFPPEYRFEEIIPSYYEDLAKAPDPLKAAQFVYDEYRRGYPMSRPDVAIFVDEWNKQHPHPFIMANYGQIKRLRFFGKGGLKGMDDKGIAEELGLSVEFVTLLRLQQEGNIPDFIISQDMNVVNYVLSLQKRIEKLEQKNSSGSEYPSTSEINDFINRMDAEPTNHEVELKIIRKGGRSAIDIDMNKFVALYSKGLPDGEIARELKVSRRTIIRRREELGLKPNRTSGQRGPGKKIS